MNLQGRNLQQDLTGDDLRLLHTELSLPNLFHSRQRPCRSALRPATQAVVLQFQKQHTLPTNGVVRYSGRHQHNGHRTVQPHRSGVTTSKRCRRLAPTS
jgi:hypothetical protein